MSNRKYIHLHLSKFDQSIKVNGKELSEHETYGFNWLFDWGNLNGGSKNLALAICKELYPGHDLHEKFLKDYISKLKDSDTIEVSLDITEFVRHAQDVIRIKQTHGVESIEDCLPF
jgi:hypothetical protein